jgi:hypothetical protein
VKTLVSLNTIMIDGTGMCGGCRVSVGGETKFVCVDGPEFDGHLVDWSGMMSRLRSYKAQEEEAHHKCHLDLGTRRSDGMNERYQGNPRAPRPRGAEAHRRHPRRGPGLESPRQAGPPRPGHALPGRRERAAQHARGGRGLRRGPGPPRGRALPGLQERALRGQGCPVAWTSRSSSRRCARATSPARPARSSARTSCPRSAGASAPRRPSARRPARWARASSRWTRPSR